jgi:uncharacterized protein YbaR (Trm112 family)
MPDDPMADPEQYDEPICIAVCPMCGSPLAFDESMKEDGYKWWCPDCEGYVRNDELPPLTARPIHS